MSRRRPASRPPVTPIAVRVSTAALMIDCAESHIYQLVERGTLRRQRIEGSRAVRIPTEDIYRVLGLEAPAPGGDENDAVPPPKFSQGERQQADTADDNANAVVEMTPGGPDDAA